MAGRTWDLTRLHQQMVSAKGGPFGAIEVAPAKVSSVRHSLERTMDSGPIRRIARRAVRVLRRARASAAHL